MNPADWRINKRNVQRADEYEKLTILATWFCAALYLVSGMLNKLQGQPESYEKK